MKKLWCLFVWLVCLSHSVRAVPTDSIRISLLTCAPGTAIYALFGHTALRYENLSTQEDWVFNYGMFDFGEPNFVYRFVKGETDYWLGYIDYNRFKQSYIRRGSTIFQQELNLTQAEKVRMLQLLQENLQPQHIQYRYNYFYHNCTTRARDKIEECVDGQILYTKNEETITFRDIIHEYTQGHPWSELGIDLCLGSEADEPIDERAQMFAPFYMLNAARRAMVHRADTIVPLVLRETEVTAESKVSESFFLSPVACAWGLLALTVFIILWSVKRRKVMWFWDAVLYGLQGLGGCIIAFLFFFSVHPTVGSNWMLALFNPVPLLYLPMMIYKGVKGEKDLYHWVNLVYLTLFIVLIPFLPQEINATIVPLALSLLLNSAGHLYVYYKKGL